MELFQRQWCWSLYNVNGSSTLPTPAIKSLAQIAGVCPPTPGNRWDKIWLNSKCMMHQWSSMIWHNLQLFVLLLLPPSRNGSRDDHCFARSPWRLVLRSSFFFFSRPPAMGHAVYVRMSNKWTNSLFMLSCFLSSWVVAPVRTAKARWRLLTHCFLTYTDIFQDLHINFLLCILTETCLQRYSTGNACTRNDVVRVRSCLSLTFTDPRVKV